MVSPELEDYVTRAKGSARRLSRQDLLELRFTKGDQQYDKRPVPGASRDDLDDALLDDFAQAIGASGVESAINARSLLTPDGRPTVSAVLMFGKAPQRFFPEARIRVLKWRTRERLLGRRQDIELDRQFEGTIPQQLKAARECVLELLPTVRRLGREGEFIDESVIPVDAWLEGLVNAAIHRSYSLAGDHIRFEIFPDRIEITSPGRFPGLSNPKDAERIARFARNPHIARIASDLRIGQELGEGIRRIFAEMRTVGFEDPFYEQTSGTVILTLTARKRVSPELMAGLHPRAMDVLDVLRTAAKPMGTSEVANWVGLSVPVTRKALQSLRGADLVVWKGVSPKDPRATWRVADVF